MNDTRPIVAPHQRGWRLHALARPAGVVLAGMASLSIAVVFFGQGGQDDTYITYWPAEALAEHGEIVNYNGLRLEQSSSLSLVLLLALFYKLTPFAMPTVGYLTSLAAALATSLLSLRLARRMGLHSRVGVVTAVLTAAPFGYWATSGTETPLAAFAALWFIDALTLPPRQRSATQLLSVAAAALLFAGVRPEAPVLVLGLVLVFVVVCASSGLLGSEEHGLPLRSWATRAAIGVAAVAVLFGFRKLYFGAWLPNPATVKSHGFDADQGFLYLWDVAIRSGVFALMLAAAGLFLVAWRHLRGSVHPVAALIAALAIGQLGFLVLSSGDWMIGGRFLAPIVPPLVLLGFLAIEAAVPAAGARRSCIAAYTALNVIFAVQWLHQGHSDGQPLWTMKRVLKRIDKRLGEHSFARVEFLNQIHRRDAFTTHALLPIADAVVGHVKSRPVYVMTGQAGMIAYHLVARHYRRIVLLDLWSLTDRKLIDCFPPGSIQMGRWGTFLGTHPLVQHEWLQAHCGLPLPDIYFNESLTPGAQALLDELGYVVVYHQLGHMSFREADGYDWYRDQVGRIGHPGPKHFLRSHNEADGHIAIKKDVAKALGLKQKPTWAWDL